MEDDDAFCEHMKRMWGGKDGDSDGDTLSSSGNHMQGSHHRGAQSTLAGDSSKPDEVNGRDGEYGGNSSIRKSNGGGQTIHEYAESAVADPPGAREAWAPFSRDDASASRSSTSHQESEREAAGKTLNVPPGILGIIGRARSNLVSGGMCAAFQLLKGLRAGDQAGNGNVTLSAFKTALSGTALGLKEAEMRILFQVSPRQFK